jgi:hypothetical protein
MKARSTAVQTSTIEPHLSRVVRIINLGLQPGFVWEGKEIEADYKLEFVFEIRDQNMADGRPFWVSKDINNKDSDKSTLYSWAAACGTTCNTIDKMLNAPVMMTPKLKASGWPTVDTVAGLPSVLAAGVTECENEVILFDFTDDEPDMDNWYKMPENTQKKIMAALDWNDYPIAQRVAAEQM